MWLLKPRSTGFGATTRYERTKKSLDALLPHWHIVANCRGWSDASPEAKLLLVMTTEFWQSRKWIRALSKNSLASIAAPVEWHLLPLLTRSIRENQGRILGHQCLAIGESIMCKATTVIEDNDISCRLLLTATIEAFLGRDTIPVELQLSLLSTVFGMRQNDQWDLERLHCTLEHITRSTAAVFWRRFAARHASSFVALDCILQSLSSAEEIDELLLQTGVLPHIMANASIFMHQN
ncbi:MAG: hypothetical protein MHM6MM_003698 [Cercozoa sp. M6MM]